MRRTVSILKFPSAAAESLLAAGHAEIAVWRLI